MSEFDEHGVALAAPEKTRSQGIKLADLRQRLTRTLVGGEPDAELQPAAEEDGLQHTQPLEWESDMPRFAVVRHGYHCAAVDEYVTDLERELADLDQELAQLRAQVPGEPPSQPAAGSPVEAEIKRIGEQTSAVLIAAHEQAQDTIRDAQAEAERCLNEARSQAATIVCEANQRLHELEREMDVVKAQRERLLGDVRSAATALNELVDVSRARFPAGDGSPEHDSDGPDHEDPSLG